MKRSFSIMSNDNSCYNQPIKYRRLNNNDKMPNKEVYQIKAEIQSLRNEINTIKHELMDIKSTLKDIKLFVGMEYKKFTNPPSYIF